MNQKSVMILSSTHCEDPCHREKHREKSGCSFQVKWRINPYMKIGSVSIERAKHQHSAFAEALVHHGAEVIKLPFLHGAFDSVFMKDNGILFKAHPDEAPIAILANPKFENRKSEPAHRTKEFARLGMKTVSIESDFEGGDFVMLSNSKLGFLGYGFRSAPSAAKEISSHLKRKVIPLKLCDPYFYHLDTALNFISFEGPGYKRIIAFVLREAFDSESMDRLRKCDEISEIVYISRKEALSFALNWVEVKGVIITGSHAPELSKRLESFGKRVHRTPLDEFQQAGGSAACLTSKIHFMSQDQDVQNPDFIKKMKTYETHAQ